MNSERDNQAGRRAFIRGIPEQVRRLHDAWDQVCQNRDDQDRFKGFQLQVHELERGASEFGLITICRRLHGLRDLLVDESTIDAELRDLHQVQISEALRDFEKAALVLERMAGELQEGEEVDEDPPVPEESRVFILSQERVDNNLLAKLLKEYGFEAAAFNKLSDLKVSLAKESPLAMVVDVALEPTHKYAVALQHELLKLRGEGIPTIYLVVQGEDLSPWLGAVRSGADACFARPVNIHRLVTKLNSLGHKSDGLDYRVLIVSDDRQDGLQLGNVLETVGMRVKLLANPLQLMKPMVEFRPDLILMALEMEVCTGLDMATVLCQNETFANVPIQFVGDSGNEALLEALKLSGYDFLLKPVHHNQLIASIAAKVKKQRSLQVMVERDPLTEVLNHAHLRTQIEVEISRTRRQETRFSLAMIDIDNFRTVNRTYGYPCGDIVLQSLGQLLMGRLRRTDIIGRLGEDRFVVLLEGADLFIGARILNELRWDFHRVTQQFNNVRFHVTFSGGVVSFPDFKDKENLLEAGEKALALAKAQGRNQVVSYTAEQFG